ncbi:ATP-binding protein [Microbispora triticiradicis]|uniref:ATP-binding protein n=1 Tax=Microbispora triticiradicis TaxID=2200763 RepID=UPI001AD722D6|nr:ATP-binding protein [Microbispora triticiradicis]MBO4271246.1 hypothetical protein [Microbispora triticiradicis]
MEPEALNAVLDTVGAGVPADALESETLDFKLVADSRKATFNLLADALVCFINAQGGTVVLGVDDKATVRESALRGVPAAYSLDEIRKGVFDRTSPPITPFVVERFVDGVRLVAVSVPCGVMPHSNAAGLATRRLGKECLPFPPAQQREVMIARGQIDWSAEASDAGLDDLSAVEVARLRDLLVAAGRDHIAELSDRAMLEALRLVAPDGGVTNAGLLLLADERVLRTVVPGYHRSYETGGTVDIEHSPERLVITSPGGLVAGVTPDNILTHPSTPRNRLLTEAISTLQLAERTGQGIDRAYREMLRVGKEPPTIEDNHTFVRATLPGGIGNDAFVRFVGELPAKAGRDVNVLLTLSHLRGTSTVDAPRLAAVIQRPPAEAQEVLSRMAEEFALLEPTRRTVRKPFPTYRLRAETVAAMSRAVAYRRRGVDGTDQKVIDHVREYGFVTNRTLQRLFDIQVYAARDMLNDLRARGILEKIGDARGGTGVRYGPGPAFPH